MSRKSEEAYFGFTILDKRLFVASAESSKVEVYDLMNFTFIRRWKLKDLIDPVDIVSCDRNKCLYIYDNKGVDQSKEILRVDPNGKLMNKWSTKDDEGARLSVTKESNVIFAVNNKNKLNEYSPDGELIREINLSDAGISTPWHAIKLGNDLFMVSYWNSRNYKGTVSKVDADGQLKKSFCGRPGSTLTHINVPFHFFVDGNGFVMVADYENRQVLLLDSDLEFKREILSNEKHGLGYI